MLLYLRRLLVLAGVLGSFFARVNATVFYHETFGSSTGIYKSVSSFTGWSASDCTYAGTARVGTGSSYSCPLPSSSGQANLYFPSASYNRFTVSGLSTSSYTDVILSFFARVDTGADVLRVYYSTDEGSTWTPVSFSSSVTSAWSLLQSTTALPSSERLSLKIENSTVSSDLLLIDDLTLSGTSPSSVDIPPVTFSHTSGTYYSPFTLTLSSSLPSSEIRYTLDGSPATSSSPLYSSPLSVSSDVTVSAVVVYGEQSGDAVTATYHVVLPPSYSGIAALKSAPSGELCRLLLSDAVVTSVSPEEFFVQDSGGGLRVVAPSVPYLSGDALTGSWVGRVSSSDGLYTLTLVSSSDAGVTSGGHTVSPYSDWSVLLSDPVRYYGCRVSLSEVLLNGDNCFVPVPGVSGVPFYDYFNVSPPFSSSDTPFTVSGLLLPHSGVPSLSPVTPADVVYPSSEPLPSAGRVLLCESPSGLHAVVPTLTNGALQAERLYRSGDKIIVTSSQITSGALFWTVDRTSGSLQSSTGKYLSTSSSTSTTPAFYSTKNQAPLSWNWSEDGGWQLRVGTSSRSLLYSYVDDYFKFFATSNVHAPGYAYSAAQDVPAYPGFVRPVTPGRFGTLCLPYDVSSSDLGSVELYTLSGRYVDSEGRTTSVLLCGPHSRLQAGVPYIFRTDSSLLVWPYSGTAVSSASSSNGLVGTLSGINTSQSPSSEELSGCYVLSSNSLRRCSAGSSLAPERAYVRMESVPVLETSVRGLVLPLSSPSDVLSSPSGVPVSADASVYTLQGVKVGEGPDFEGASRLLPPGLYLYRGQKYLRRSSSPARK